jgi:hypothetical protein
MIPPKNRCSSTRLKIYAWESFSYAQIPEMGLPQNLHFPLFRLISPREYP